MPQTDKDNETDVQGMGVLPGLLLAHERVEFLRLSFQDTDGKAMVVEEQVIDVAICSLLEIVTEGVQGLLLKFDLALETLPFVQIVQVRSERK